MTSAALDAATLAMGAGTLPTAVVRLDSVTKHYPGGGGIDEVSLEVAPGELFGFLGPNGAGKTTTIRLLVDLIRPDHGRVELFGLDARHDGVRARRRIGYLPGDLALYERLTARELLSHFAYLRRRAGHTERSADEGGPVGHDPIGGSGPGSIEALSSRFDLDLDRPIRSLSKGNRQKVGLVQALMGEPDLLILDEPTPGLDPLVQHEVHEVLREAVSGGRTVFLSSHALSEVEQVADRVGMIRSGRLVAVERVDELRSRSVHLVELRTADPLEPEAFAQLEGVVASELGPRGGRLEVSGPLDPVVGELARHHLLDLSIREPDLEEVFLSFYERDDHLP